MTTTFSSTPNETQALAHQLLNPVTAAGNYAAALLETLRAGRLTAEKAEAGLQKIVNETERARRTAAALRRLFRAEHPSFAAHNAAALVQSASNHLGIKPILATAGTICDVLCDADLIEEVLVNLLTNAEAARCLSQNDTPVTLELRGTADGVLFRVTNCTSDPEKARAVMTARTRSATPGGSGIGLFLVRKILAAHHTELTVSVGAKSITATFELTSA